MEKRAKLRRFFCQSVNPPSVRPQPAKKKTYKKGGKVAQQPNFLPVIAPNAKVMVMVKS